ncbi:MAG TPA: cytochrome c biogenesis protein CcsA [Cyclobacteriaceae bacterium]|nr:cytochrome c biogenesis protein CcsA [Cyclobacteriaceae bacterium]HMV10148.1 cytochrome c biogenesis protein CcsA [Cyclobacteriaceae bacterium]HMV90743.1 cytochrome c biogenesis protein CcsA [Cyclobacteriaceae bacterium]HMX00537.1 cytochrome c biogenesis protein CcsA [Cyclobacteriaceae bacterium]HMX49588.1 cytochrome c biogenesis protein CcsA [Cyclobacteriaceae bacterium]
MHYFIGHLGHLFVIISFVAAIATAFSYFKATNTSDLSLKSQWLINGRVGFYIHATAVLGICVTLFAIISNHYFEYHYAYSHSDKKLPTYYLISTFWNGQEGSFLLWMFWHAIIGIVLIYVNKFWEAPVMTVFALVQAFLASMILGVVIPGIEFKIGSSPFILLRDALPDPIFKIQPDFIPEDGTGLNPLLQNYWMVIHPPTLFLGFALTLVPFSFCIAGLWIKKYSEWIRPALPWSLVAGAILGLGILMGGYWAYETLNFGGYWNWDPVENAVYVPWLVLIASIHTMITYRNSGTALKASMILVIMVFVLILYSTFLTRSGVLGDASVHSFTDLGLSGQLLIYLFFFVLIAIVFTTIRWKQIPITEKETAVWSREFWIFIGATVLCLMGFQVLIPTSIPVWNRFIEAFGGSSNLAPPADQLTYYSKFQLWFALAVGLLSGVGQFFWWKKMDRKVLLNELFVPIIASLLVSVVIINVAKTYNIGYSLLLFAGLFTFFSNLKILYSVLRTSPSLSGGAVAHIGIGLMLIGIMFSSGYSRVVSLNNTGMLISKQLSEEFNRENLLLFVNEPRTMAGYDIEYAGERVEPRNKKGYVDKNDIETTPDKHMVIARRDIYIDGEKIFIKGEKFEIFGENTFYEILFSQGGKHRFTLRPRLQVNEQMGTVASPDISHAIGLDLYAHVSAPMTEEAREDWKEREEVRVKRAKEFYVNDYVAVVEKLTRLYQIGDEKIDSTFVAIQASIKVQGERKDYYFQPILILGTNSRGGIVPDEIGDLGLKISLMNVHPESDGLTLGIQTRQKNWVVIKAMEKPFVNVLWIGTLILMAGFGIALTRRFREFSKMKAKGQE